MIEERCQFWAKKRFLKVGSYLRKISKAEICTHVRELDSMSELSGFVYIKSHVTLHVNSEAQKVNYEYCMVNILSWSLNKRQLNYNYERSRLAYDAL